MRALNADCKTLSAVDAPLAAAGTDTLQYPAAAGGPAVRATLLPYGRPQVHEDDIDAVVSVLRSDWLTTGPAVDAFEEAVRSSVGAQRAVAVSSGTAALHAAMHALGVGPGDEVIVPPLTFIATANAVLFAGGTPVFADVDRETLLLDPAEAAARITPRTRAVIAVDYAGQPCDYDALRALCERRGLALVADACHALGATYRGRKVGTLADLTVFSFHPVKHITTGEGGAVVTDSAKLAEKMRRFRNHGVSSDHRQRAREGTWVYEMVDLGYNYRISDLQCALGASQLKKLPAIVARRREIARRYDEAFSDVAGLSPLKVAAGVEHAYHLYPVRLDPCRLRADRAAIFSALRQEGIGLNVHYLPVHLHPYYRRRFGLHRGHYPVAEEVYEHILSLPMFHAMSDRDVEDVVAAVRKVTRYYAG